MQTKAEVYKQLSRRAIRRGHLLAPYFPTGDDLVIAEIGVMLGHFAREMLNHTFAVKCYLIDPWDTFARQPFTGDEAFDEARELIDSWICAADPPCTPEVLFIRELSETGLDRIPDGELDVLNIDGDHSYRGASHDLLHGYKKLKPGGVMMGDDWRRRGPPGDGTQPLAPEFGVIKAVADFIHPDTCAEVHIIEDQFVIRKHA